MTTQHILPKIMVRDTSPPTKAKRKQPRIPTLSGHGVSRYSDRIVAGVLFDLQRKPLLQVALDWNIKPTTVASWMNGRCRAHVTPVEWPASESKRQT